VIPDASLFTSGEGSLAAEVGFTLEGSMFIDATVNESVWSFAKAGSNPFTGTTTTGLELGETEAFASFGSDPVSGPVELLTFTTNGATGNLNFGGYTIDEGQLGEFTGARLAQAGLNFDNIIGSASFVVGSPIDCNNDGVVNSEDLLCACGGANVIDAVLEQTGLVRGDLNANSEVDFTDFLVLSTNFGMEGVGYVGGDLDCDGTVAFADFLGLSTNFGRSSETLASVPEPAGRPWLAPLITGMLLRLRASRKS